MKTLKYLIGTTVALAMFGMAGSAMAGVVGSKHDLTTTGAGPVQLTAASAPTTDQSCAFCHTPHGGLSPTAGGPLWNRAASAAVYTPYTNANNPAIDASATVAPVSLACLSCHDGTVALDALQNTPGSGDDAGATTLGYDFTAASVTAPNLMLAGSIANIGNDLSNDHPITQTYTPGGGFEAVATLTTAGVPLYTGMVECASCHDVHNAVPANQPFLRVSNVSSGLCTTCHIK